ncbi:hypothetical protein [Methylobacterium isbiliense]|uniref:Uncharacterized protein n=1 Tax=Methylobacterium isbiliense TaxID=315478 RepID=A0ABQ4SC04_9HYPH|nr:hypothetical protein [Methylobacterium isbiliense]MDN3627426.1 hypothetical protein [Methylobacterium isbiliense]GJE00647.1 hypothetical protein GMJLKIPL_2571 [Methylobacterium isbiliense]
MARQPRKLAGIGAADLSDMNAINAYVGPMREVIVDGQTLRLQNGQTPGGIPLATQAGLTAGMNEAKRRGKRVDLSANPTLADLPEEGDYMFARNTQTGKLSFWHNAQGVIKDAFDPGTF